MIISKQKNAALKVIKKRSTIRLIVKHIYMEMILRQNTVKIIFYLCNKKKKIKLPIPLLNGIHQIENASVSIAALIELNVEKLS